MVQSEQPYSYRDAGFSSFLRRSIDNPRTPVSSLTDYARTAQQNSRSINFDNAPVSGQLSEVTKVGNSIVLDGKEGKISVVDDQNNENVRLGNLDG